MKNLQTLIVYVRRIIGEVSVQKYFTDAEITDYLNDGQRLMVEVAQPLQIFYQFSTNINQQEYLLPATVDQVFDVALYYGSLFHLQWIDPRLIQQGVGFPGRPDHYYTRQYAKQTAGQTVGSSTSGITVAEQFPNFSSAEQYGTMLGLYPIPNAVAQCTVSYYSQALDMVNNADQPVIPFQFREGLVAYAVHKCKEKDDAYAESNLYLEKFDQFKTGLANKERYKGVASARKIKLADDIQPKRGVSIYIGRVT